MDVIRLRIREARCRSADGRRFIPEGSLASVLSHEVIQHSLQTHCDVEPFAVQWMTRAVHQGGMKTFAVLILIRAENKIGTFLESYLQSDSQKLDSRLPFSKVDLEATLSLDFASEFQERQWELMAPVFTNRLLHRKIPVEYSLPFLESRRIGGGGFGDVYEVLVAAGHHNFHNVDSTQPARLVRKELRKGFGTGDLWSEVGSNEHQIMSYLYHLKHPSILPLLTSYTYNGIPNFLLPFAEGGDLEQFLNNNSRPGEFARDTRIYGAISGLASGLETLHSYKSEVLGKEMIGYHHDLKPKNVLVSKGRFILSDFGLSKLKSGEDSRTPFKKGQGHYLAPECEDLGKDFSKGIISRASDAWSLGCIILEVIVFMVGGSDGITRFREARTSTRGFLTTRTFFTDNAINIGVEKMLTELADNNENSIKRSAALIRQILVIDLERRIKAGQIAVGFRFITLEASYFRLCAAFEAIEWRIEDRETVTEWQMFRQSAHILFSSNEATAIHASGGTSSGFFASGEKAQLALNAMHKMSQHIAHSDSSVNFTKALLSELKRVNIFLKHEVTDNRREGGPVPEAEAESADVANETAEHEHTRELSWIQPTLTIPTANVRNATMSKDERFLAVECDRQIVIYALPSGDRVRTVGSDGLQPATREWNGQFPQFAFTPDGKKLLVCWRRDLCYYETDGGNSEGVIIFPPLSKQSQFSYQSRSETMMMLVMTGVAAVSADSSYVAVGATRRRPTMTDSFEELVFVVQLTNSSWTYGPLTQTIIGEYDCLAGFSPDSRQLAISGQRSVRHDGRNAVRIRLVNVFGDGTATAGQKRPPPEWATVYCDEKIDKGPRNLYVSIVDVRYRYPRLTFATWESRWVAALWEKSKRRLILHDLHSRSNLASFNLFIDEIFGCSSIEKVIFSADLKVAGAASLGRKNPSSKAASSFLSKKKKTSTDGEVVFTDVKTGKVTCTLKGGGGAAAAAAADFDEYWLSHSGRCVVTRKKRELRLYSLLG